MRAYSEGNYESAITFFEAVLVNEPEAADIYYYIAESYHAMGDDSNAYFYYGQALDVEPYFAPAYVGRGVSRLGIDENEVKASKADIKTAIEIDPNYVEAYLQLALIILDELDGRTALEYLDTALELSPDSALIYYQRARAYQLLNEPQQALQEALTAHELDLTLVPVYRLIGELYFLLKEPKEAVDYLVAYTVYFPEDAQALAWLGAGFAEQGETDSAFEVLDEALVLAPNTFDALLQRGILYAEEDRLTLAESDLQKALSLQPRSFESNLYLGKVYFLEDQYYQAYAKLAYAAGLDITEDQMVQVYYWRAQVLEGLNELKTAARDWQALLDMPEELVPVSWRNLAQSRLNELITPTRTPEGYQSSSTPFRTSTPTAVTPAITLTPSPTPAN
jgi:tetratricopeptide (TPR) repeat protein